MNNFLTAEEARKMYKGDDDLLERILKVIRKCAHRETELKISDVLDINTYNKLKELGYQVLCLTSDCFIVSWRTEPLFDKDVDYSTFAHISQLRGVMFTPNSSTAFNAVASGYDAAKMERGTTNNIEDENVQPNKDVQDDETITITQVEAGFLLYLIMESDLVQSLLSNHIPSQKKKYKKAINELASKFGALAPRFKATIEAGDKDQILERLHRILAYMADNSTRKIYRFSFKTS